MNEIHVCLLSEQLLPNLIPVLMERPARVYLVATDAMKNSGQDKRMRRMLRREDIETFVRSGAPSTGIEAIRRFAAKLAYQLPKEMPEDPVGGTIVLNATGGTKLLSMGFVEVFREQLEGRSLRNHLHGYPTSGHRNPRASQGTAYAEARRPAGGELPRRSGNGARADDVRR